MRVIDLDINTAVLMAIALLNAFTAYMTHNNRKNIRIIETATNSMKDALVAATAKASLAEGTAIGRQQVTAELETSKDK
jgi:hypothetical protein